MHKFFLIFFFSFNAIFAHWDCSSFINENNIENNKVLNNPEWINLESKVLQYLKNSWCSEEKAKLIMEVIALVEPKICVEIGAFTGSTTFPYLMALQYLNKGHAYIIDPWSSSENVRNLNPEDPNTKWWGSLDMKKVRAQFDHMINEWNLQNICTVLPMTSEKAATKIPTAIDFIHLDGNFSEEGALFDTLTYLPKVRSGGFILISNVFMMIDHKATKIKAILPLFDECEIVAEIENSNVILFRKK